MADSRYAFRSRSFEIYGQTVRETDGRGRRKTRMIANVWRIHRPDQSTLDVGGVKLSHCASCPSYHHPSPAAPLRHPTTAQHHLRTIPARHWSFSSYFLWRSSEIGDQSAENGRCQRRRSEQTCDYAVLQAAVTVKTYKGKGFMTNAYGAGLRNWHIGSRRTQLLRIENCQRKGDER